MNSTENKELKRGKTYCLRLLSLRPRSEREIEFRLKSKGYSDRSRKELLELLKSEGLVDDAEFARQWIDSRIRSNPKGKRALRQELASKGVAGEVIEKVFSEKVSQLDEKAIAGELVKKTLAKEKKEQGWKLKGKLYQYLLRRGISSEIAQECIDEIE
ncbi:MAG: regulatory protein RecX [Candidatus Omnitrophota bacterium]